MDLHFYGEYIRVEWTNYALNIYGIWLFAHAFTVLNGVINIDLQ